MASLYNPTALLPEIPDNLTVAQFMLDYNHAIRPTRKAPCLIEDQSGKRVNLTELRQRTRSLAMSLSSKYGLGDNDIIMLLSPNDIDYPVALWAVHKLGGIVTCSNPQFTVDELAYQLNVSKATFLITHSSVLDTALSAARRVHLPLDRVVVLDHQFSGPAEVPTVSDLIMEGLKEEHMFMERILSPGEGRRKVALLCWSSGTTGKPKAVAISHYALIANVIQMAVHNQVNKPSSHRDYRTYRPGDIALGVLPFYHVAGLVISLHLVIFCAMSLVVVPRYNFLAMLDQLKRHRVSHLHLVPPQAVSLSKYAGVSTYDLREIKYLMIGAAPVSQEVQNTLFDMFPDAQIGQAYGLTEMTTTLAMVSAAQKRSPLGSGGRLLPGVQARVIKSDGTLAKIGEPGELVVKGPSAALGYFNDEKSTKETFIDGWVYTGDEVIINREQEVYVLDRLKELLKVKGMQVAPAELEGCLLGHPEVVDACVIGIPDNYYGELPLAYVVLSADAVKRISRDPTISAQLRASIAEHVANRKAHFKHLKGGVRIIDSIPKNGSGKILRRVLREKARELTEQDTRAKM